MEARTIAGQWDDRERAWVSETLQLTGDCWVEISLGAKGRLLVRKSENTDGPWPKALVSEWTGPEFRIRMYGGTKYRFVRLYLTRVPERAEVVNI